MHDKIIKSFLKFSHTAFLTILASAAAYAQLIPSGAVLRQKKEVSLTAREVAFIQEHPVLTVVADPNWPPFEYIDFSSAVPSYAGINIEILRLAMAKMGIELNFISTKNYTESKQIFNQGRADIIAGFTENLLATENVMNTESVYEFSLVLASSTGEMPPKGSVIGMPICETLRQEAVASHFPQEDYTILMYDFPALAVRAFRQGKIKYLIVGPYEIQDFRNLSVFTTFDLQIPYWQQYGVNARLGDEALSVINKALGSITPQELDLVVYRALSDRRFFLRERDLYRKTQKNAVVFVVISLSVILFLAVTIIFLFLRKKRRLIGEDELTGLPTLAQFKKDVRRVLKTAKSEEYMFISLDIDNFKIINNGYGYTKGNMLLMEQGQYFKRICGKNGDMALRFFADNFIIFTKNPGSIAIVEDKVCELTEICDSVKKILPEHCTLTFSSGVYYIDDPHGDITLMLDKANIARKGGKNAFITRRTIEYTKEMDEENNWNREIVLTMENALKDRQFQVFYQPKFSLSNSKIIGAEALIRWNHPQKGLLAPDKFVPLFESNGFIQKIDIYVFEEVCRFLSEWNKMGPGGTCPSPLTISFNLSRYHLYNPNLISELKGIFNNYNVYPSHVEVELTETIMFDNPNKLVNVMNEIKKAGFSISVDDFGSGYSSLNLLKDMPADVLKLDKEFLSKTNDDAKENIIISSVIEMAKKLKMTTVAEGIESQKQSDLLRNMGCDVAQGFYYAHPMPEEDFLSTLRQHFGLDQDQEQ